VRTQTGVKPVYVSVGHRIGLPSAAELTVRLSGRYRVPEPTRQADIISREVLRDSWRGMA
jgi:deoxyribonuclease V